MPTSPPARRWGAVYDAAQLAAEIEQLALAFLDGTHRFYDLRWAAGSAPCQGDVVELACDLPLIGKDGSPVTEEGDGLWIMLGNSCDLTRTADDVTEVPIIPIERIEPNDTEVRNYRQYNAARRFYIPRWPGLTDPSGHYVADFMRITPLHREALRAGVR